MCVGFMIPPAGDVTQRHNQARDLVFDLARRARTNRKMEQPGPLAEPGV